MKGVVFTLGCKVNDVESGSIIRALKEMGHEISKEMERADFYVINTCAVTGEAERKSRQTVSKALKYNANAKVIVMGCASQKNAQAFMEKGVFAVLGAQRKVKAIEIVESNFSKEFAGINLENDGGRYENMPIPECLKTRNFVKIQDGCNRFCSYCVIPYLRGRSRSRLLEDAAEEILQSTAGETVITGIDISAYQDENGKDLADLMLAVKDANTRIRLGSMEVSLINDRFLSALKQVKNFAPQFHLSLQSGSSAVLKSMNRHYTREEYLSACESIYKAFPNAAITTDIIVGFPTETEDDFQESLSIIEKAGFSQIHAFPYSPREGTNAFKRYKELPSLIKKERLQKILKAGQEQSERYKRKFIAKTLEIVPERCIGGVSEGYSENYLRVYVQGDIGKKTQKVKVEKLYADGVLASVLESVPADIEK